MFRYSKSRIDGRKNERLISQRTFFNRKDSGTICVSIKDPFWPYNLLVIFTFIYLTNEAQS